MQITRTRAATRRHASDTRARSAHVASPRTAVEYKLAGLCSRKVQFVHCLAISNTHRLHSRTSSPSDQIHTKKWHSRCVFVCKQGTYNIAVEQVYQTVFMQIHIAGLDSLAGTCADFKQHSQRFYLQFDVSPPHRSSSPCAPWWPSPRPAFWPRLRWPTPTVHRSPMPPHQVSPPSAFHISASASSRFDMSTPIVCANAIANILQIKPNRDTLSLT